MLENYQFNFWFKVNVEYLLNSLHVKCLTKYRGVRCKGSFISLKVNQSPIILRGLRSLTNNEVEAYGLYARINLALSKQIKELIICEDSILIIRENFQRNIIEGIIYNGIMSRSLWVKSRRWVTLSWQSDLQNSEKHFFGRTSFRPKRGTSNWTVQWRHPRFACKH
jgi:hypothetical protein